MSIKLASTIAIIIAGYCGSSLAQHVYDPPKGLRLLGGDDLTRYRQAAPSDVAIVRIRSSHCEDLARQILMQSVSETNPNANFVGIHRLYWNADTFDALRMAIQPCKSSNRTWIENLDRTIDLVEVKFGKIAQNLIAREAGRKAAEVERKKAEEAEREKMLADMRQRAALAEQQQAAERAARDAESAKRDAEFLAARQELEAEQRELERRNANAPVSLSRLVEQFTIYQFAEHCAKLGIGVTGDQLKAVGDHLKQQNRTVEQAMRDEAWTRATIGTRIQAPKLTRRDCADMPGLLATEFPVMSSPGLQRSPF